VTFFSALVPGLREVRAPLLGSLVQSAFRLVSARFAQRFAPIRLDEDQQVLFEEIAQSERPFDIEMILRVADPSHDASTGRPFLDDISLSLSIWEIADRELIESFRQLQLAVERFAAGWAIRPSARSECTLVPRSFGYRCPCAKSRSRMSS
jgi:hypothetical protein